MKPAAKPAPKPAPVAKPAAKPAVKPRPKPRPRPQYERANMRAGYKLYNRKSFSEASTHFRRISSGKQYRRSDRKRAGSLAGKIDDFGGVYGKANSAVKAFQPVTAIPLLEKARKLDKGINGTFSGELRRSLARMYAFRAAGAYSSNKFKQAARLARKALTYNAGESSAQLIYEKVESKVEGMMAQARSAKASGNSSRAEKLLKTVMGILPQTDQRYREARRTLNDLMAARAEEDDD